MLPTVLHRLPRIAGAAIIAAALVMPLGQGAWAKGGASSGSGSSTPTLAAADQAPQFWFGVAVENIPPSFAKQMKLKPDQGVMVVAVFANSPAAKAGLKQDDILIEINNQPLTSQEELAAAANTPSEVQIGTTKTPQSLMKQGDVIYLRDGDRHVAHLTPEVRPTDMLVEGANTSRFTPSSAAIPQQPPPRDYILSNNTRVQVGPGIHIDSSSQQNLTLLQNAVGKGASIVIIQETDDAGTMKLTIRDGDKSYPVDAGKLDQLPDNLRPLATQLLQRTRAAAATPSNDSPAANKPLTTDDRLKLQGDAIEELKQQNAALQQQTIELQRKIDLLIQGLQPRATPNKGTPADNPPPVINPAPAANPAAH